MSVAKKVFGKDGPAAGQKVLLRRRGPDLWRMGFAAWAGTAQVRWKALAMMQLHVHCNWSLQMIGMAFGQHRGRVSRLIRDAARRIADQGARDNQGVNDDISHRKIWLSTSDSRRLREIEVSLHLGPAAALHKCLHESETFIGATGGDAENAPLS